MSRFADRKELAAKIDWEGGLEDALHYGIRMKNLPENDIELEHAWYIMEISWDVYKRYAEEVMKLLPPPWEEDDSIE